MKVNIIIYGEPRIYDEKIPGLTNSFIHGEPANSCIQQGESMN
jgi:hypothetical protein